MILESLVMDPICMCNEYTPDIWNRSSTPTPQVYYSFDKIDKDTTCGYMSLAGGASSIDGKVLNISSLRFFQQYRLYCFKVTRYLWC